jgi:predicted TIM-barrel fold metal-dependent hydrolase
MAPLVDFHTHFFSHALFEALAAVSPLKGSTRERLERVSRSLGLQLPPDDPAQLLDRWLGEMERHGVSHLVSFASVPEETALLIEVAGRARGKLSAFTVVDPTRRDALQRLSGPLEAKQIRGVLLLPALHHYRLDGPEALALFELLEDHRAPAVVHCGIFRMPLRERLGLARELDLALGNPLSLVPAADRFPTLPFVIPCFGSGFLRETLMVGAQCPNVYVDTSSSNSWIATQSSRMSLADVFERALAVLGPERILFGTDSSSFPRGWRRDLFLAQKEALGACGVSEEQRSRILGLNAAHLLHLT